LKMAILIGRWSYKGSRLGALLAAAIRLVPQDAQPSRDVNRSIEKLTTVAHEAARLPTLFSEFTLMVQVKAPFRVLNVSS
jgi:hypothetical protein